jgi:hypothetical protein
MISLSLTRSRHRKRAKRVGNPSENKKRDEPKAISLCSGKIPYGRVIFPLILTRFFSFARDSGKIGAKGRRSS